MTPEQFSALAALMGQPDSKSAAAARLVLVDDLSSAEAARRVGSRLFGQSGLNDLLGVLTHEKGEE